MGKHGKIIVVTDGASRGNPGPAAVAFGVYDQDGKPIHEEAEYVGYATNNEAEYMALIRALKKCGGYRGGEVEHYTDSQLVVNQLEGKWAVKAKNLRALIEQILDMKQLFKSVIHRQLPRENPMMRRIDRLVNKKLDQTGCPQERPSG